MAVQDILKSISERLHSTASVKVVYGDPISAEGKTIIPVAQVRYGFGGGAGSRRGESASANGDGASESGGGGGGGVQVTPVGVIEITAGETRYISFEEKKIIIRAVAIGVLGGLLGAFLLMRRRRR